ncbi:MAG TPA: T9SS type A sorting domain-containing protein [Chitinophagaceae bacterium]|nr:T9SS type A sorting domain-containing protein [Chitinophagaceae bacterium]
MKKVALAAAALILLGNLRVLAQRSCASYEHLQEQMKNDPAFARKVKQNEKSFDKYIRQSQTQKGKPITLTIPVVVHVIYHTAEQNISDAQVQSQIDVLNEDYSAKNRDYNNYDAGYGAVKGDADIKFCLVQTRHVNTSRNKFGTDDGVKRSRQGGDDAIDPMNALNIWVCNLGQSLLGYAQFPGGPPETFGIVILYSAFGKGSQYNLATAYNLGRTATHEIGHCLGLRHIWGDANCGNDFVGDTPLHDSPNYGCPPQGHRSLCTGTPLEMWMNYMDYTDDRCMYFLSDGQVSRADYFIDTDAQLQSIVRSSCTTIAANATYVSTNNTATISAKRAATQFVVYPSITNNNVNIQFVAVSSGSVEVSIYNLGGALVMKQRFGVTEGNNLKSMDLTRFQNGVYVLQFNQGGTMSSAKLIVQH